MPQLYLSITDQPKAHTLNSLTTGLGEGGQSKKSACNPIRCPVSSGTAHSLTYSIHTRHTTPIPIYPMPPLMLHYLVLHSHVVHSGYAYPSTLLWVDPLMTSRSLLLAPARRSAMARRDAQTSAMQA